MPWNWELPNWPQFTYEKETLVQKERKFLLEVGSASAYLKKIEEKDFFQFVVGILSMEGLESSRIEGEILDGESLQSSIKRHFGLQTNRKQEGKKESQMAKLLCHVYETFDKPLTHSMLFKWHSMLFSEGGEYRSHPEPMQIVSHRLDSTKVFFEAPPSKKVSEEMDAFVDWFNSSAKQGSILERAAIAHVYFESIHPFEDGNGRIGRVLVEKILSQGVGRPLLISLSQVLERRKKEYYDALGKCNRTLKIEPWMEFFASAILQAQEESIALLNLLVEKSRMMGNLSGKLNTRQEKVLLRMFAQGLDGFKGGMSAEKYIAITKTSRATATRDLMDLVEKGALKKTGELRHTRYWLNLEIR